MFRLASSTVVPNAIRAIASSRILSGSITRPLFSNSHASKSCFSHSFSVKILKSFDSKLVEILKSEIKSKQSSPDITIPEAPAGFPFTIQDNCGVTLTRELAGEKIEVSVSIVNFGCDCDDDDGDGDDADEGPFLSLDVTISKENRKTLEIKVCASAHKLKIYNMHLLEPGLVWHVYVDSDLQLGFEEYLETRGIKKSYVAFLYEYMVRKYEDNPLPLLKELKKFVEE